MDPKVWGPSAWIFLHSIVLSYDSSSSSNKTNIKNFFNNLGDILPCVSCRTHYKENLKKNPLTAEVLKNRENLNKWLVDMHNQVNIITGKKILNYNNTDDVFDDICSNNTDNSKYILVVVIILVVILVCFLKNKNRR